LSSYRGTADRPDKAKAIAAVAAVHVALAAVILSGLNVSMVRHAVDQLKVITISEPPPPPPRQPPPKPAPKPQAMKKPEGAAAKKAEPSPVVAPEPRIPAPSPLPAAKVAGTGSATASGAAQSGSGTGAGGAGSGPGGGGDFSGYTPARRITRIPNSEYRGLAATGILSGNVGVTVKVNTDGSVSNCRVARSSGDRGIDGLMCQLTLRYIRFEPARDRAGRPVAQDITFYPNWYRR
jgi:periplasmic protein TonB